jgi:hypothetical protein
MTDYACFRIGDVFTPGDELSSWVATIASALNDLIATGGAAFPAEPTGQETYATRMGVAHFYELGKFLDAADSVPAITLFVQMLETPAQQEYASILLTYRQHSSRLEGMRSHGVFHYPPWNPARGAIKHGLATAAESLGVIKIDERIGGRRFLFADEIILATMAHACGGEPQMLETVKAASNAMGDFLHLADVAVADYVLGQEPDLRACEPIDANDWSKGWKYV